MALQYGMRQQNRPMNVQRFNNSVQPIAIQTYRHPYQAQPMLPNAMPVVNQVNQCTPPARQLQPPPRYQVTNGMPRMEGSRPPRAPEKPLMPYMRYSSKMFEKVKAQHPDMKLWEIGKLIGAMWRNMDDKQKQEYFDEYERDKREYNEALKAYQQSPEYQAWVISKARNNAPVPPRPQVRPAQEPQVYDKMVQRVIPTTPLPEPPVSMQIIEDEDEENELTEQHIAAARFHRNNLFMHEIFSDSAVRDFTTGVALHEDRIKTLRDKKESLKSLQGKQQADLQEIITKFEQKKRKYLQDDEVFECKLKQLCSKDKEDLLEKNDLETSTKTSM